MSQVNHSAPEPDSNLQENCDLEGLNIPAPGIPNEQLREEVYQNEDLDPANWNEQSSNDHLTQFSATTRREDFPSIMDPPDQGIPELFSSSSIHSVQALDEIPDSFIDICIILTFPEVSQNPAWSYLSLLINVTQNYIKDPRDDALPPQNSAQTSQQLLSNDASNGRLLKEITMRITIKNSLASRNRMYHFQLVCAVAEDHNLRDQIGILWSTMEVCTMVTNRATNQILQPLTRDITRQDAIKGNGNNFLGTFAFDGQILYHVNQSDPELNLHLGRKVNNGIAANMLHSEGKVIKVEKSDQITKSKKARGGRPSYKLTGELLVTKEQAEKIIEIRSRWRGLTSRQRRTHVREEDLYPLLTLNRDEAAKAIAVCTTWFKDILRLQGIVIWPGRPLRKSGSQLIDLKENLGSARAAIEFVQQNTPAYLRQEGKIRNLEASIQKKLSERLDIVKTRVSPEYFEKFVNEGGQLYLDPVWDTLPPTNSLLEDAQ